MDYLSTPTRLQTSFKVKEIISGNTSVLLRDIDGGIWAIGNNKFG